VALQACAREEWADLRGEIDQSGVIAWPLVTRDRDARHSEGAHDNQRLREYIKSQAAQRTEITVMRADRHVAIPQ
jgi:hypothetical protein